MDVVLIILYMVSDFCFTKIVVSFFSQDDSGEIYLSGDRTGTGQD